MYCLWTELNASSLKEDSLLSGFETTPHAAGFGKHRSCYPVYINMKKLAMTK